jgi:hypothetical protein
MHKSFKAVCARHDLKMGDVVTALVAKWICDKEAEDKRKEQADAVGQ